jgi:hypothetical protein
MNEALLIDVSRAFYLILNALVRLYHREMRQPLSDDLIPSKILHEPKFYLYFKDCISAINGTYIHAYIPVSEQAVWRNYKRIISQNIFAAYSFGL